jgi:Na+-translocating ferredoxin:NAD+ oxidoreductase RnfC subunit
MTPSLVDAVQAAGVIGSGGAGFPTHVKLGAQVDTVIANGAECDPLLQCDQRLMESRAAEMVRGVRLAMEATGATRAILALKEEYVAATSSLQRSISGMADVSLLLMESRYPAGDEFVLVYEATGRLVPETGLPLEVGCLVQNVQTLYNIARAADGASVTHRLLTVGGAVARPITLWAPIGAAIRDVLSWAGGILVPRWSERTVDDYAVVVGGPMMGRVATDLSEPITKTTSGLLVLPTDNAVVRYMTRTPSSWVRRGISTCDQCRDCTDLCPRFLLGHNLKPHQVMRAINYGLDRPADQVTAAVLCCECRLCEAYACPLELSPMAYYVAIKRDLRAQGWVNEVHNRREFQPHLTREYRLVPTHRLVARLGLTEWEHKNCGLDETDFRPAQVTIPLQQHIGAPAEPQVSVGQQVQIGDLIARVPEGKLGSTVHASLTGRVNLVTKSTIEIVA